MLQNELQRERERLKKRIADIEADLQPKQAELREKLTHVEALLPIEKERAESHVKAPRRIWAKMCRKHGWQIKEIVPIELQEEKTRRSIDLFHTGALMITANILEIGKSSI